MFKTVNGGKMPTRGSKYSACVDLYANADVTIGAGETELIPLGIVIDLDSFRDNNISLFAGNSEVSCFDNTPEPEYNDSWHQDFLSTHYLQLMLRSSLGKKGLIIPNGVGVIDIDFTDEIMIMVHNPAQADLSIADELCGGTAYYLENTADRHIKKGDKIAQITLLEHKSYLFNIDTEKKRVGGFGSTGNE